MRAVVIERFGGPEVLDLVEDAPVPEPVDGERLIQVSTAGVNFADTHARENAYIARYELPFTPGAEVAGVLAEDPSQRVVALTGGTGGYAEYALANAARCFPIPDGVSDGAALAVVLQGLTAWHLYVTAGHVAAGESVVVHAAAGGVGSLAVQLGHHFGAGRVIATASSEEKRARALELGADVALDPNDPELAAALIAANGGRPVDVVFEVGGGPVFEAGLAALAPFGRLVVYGIASREQNELRSGKLMRQSKAVVGFWLYHLFDRPELVSEPLAELFALVAADELRPLIGETYPLSEVARAHEDIAGRGTSGKLLIDPRR